MWMIVEQMYFLDGEDAIMDVFGGYESEEDARLIVKQMKALDREREVYGVKYTVMQAVMF